MPRACLMQWLFRPWKRDEQSVAGLRYSPARYRDEWYTTSASVARSIMVRSLLTFHRLLQVPVVLLAALLYAGGQCSLHLRRELFVNGHTTNRRRRRCLQDWQHE